MPIYAYRCSTCGHAQDVLQRIADPVLSICPACSAPTYLKQVTAAGFQLKGSGWYVTDFRGDKNAGKAAEKANGEGGSAKADRGDADGKSDKGGKGVGAAVGQKPADAGRSDSAAKEKAAPAPAPAAAAPPPSTSGKPDA